MSDESWTELETKIRATPEYKRLVRRNAIADRLTGWMRHIPMVAPIVYVFWHSLIEEGPRETLKPRWGAITFAFLNDGYRPTWYHTWHQATHFGPYARGKEMDPEDPNANTCDLCMLYPQGAPARP